MSFLGNIKHTLTKRSFIGAFVFAIALWGFASLNGEYMTLVRIPLSARLPSDRALENPLPENLTVKVGGTGWNLFNLNFLKSAAQCEIDLSDKTINDSLYRIDRAEIITSISGLSKFEPRDVYPDNLILKTGKVSEFEVPIIPNIDLETDKDYILIGDLRLDPPTVIIRGNEKIVKNIKSWATVYQVIPDVNSDFKTNVMLKDTLNGIIELSRKDVQVSADIQQMAEITFNDLQLVVKGGKLGEDQILFPSTVSVTLRGGVKVLNKLTGDRIMTYIDYSQLINDSTGVLKTYADFPDGIELLRIEPKYIRHYYFKENNNLKNYQ